MSFITHGLKDSALSSLLELIDSVRTSKILILDKSMASSFSLVVSFSVLKEHGVERIFWLQNNLTSLIDTTQLKSIIFVTRPHPDSLIMLASYIRQTIGSSRTSHPEFHLISSPTLPLSVNSILQSRGVLGDITLHSWPLYFQPAISDEIPILSLNIPGGGFKETYMLDIPSSIHFAAEAIQSLQETHGPISKIVGKGKSARLLADLLLYQRDQRSTDLADKVVGSNQEKPSPEEIFDFTYDNTFVGSKIDSLIIIDRETDMITPLLTQLTYHGLIDEFYKISDSGTVELPSEIVSPGNQSRDGSSTAALEKKRVSLHDPLFDQIHNLNFAVVGQHLNKVARQLQTDYDQRHEAKSVSEIKAFVSKLGGLQAVHQNLRFHTALTEDLMSKVQDETFNTLLEIQQNLVADSLDVSVIHGLIETLISKSSDFTTVLRLLCLECCVKGGIKERDLQFFKQEILQTYGYQHLPTLQMLEQTGLLFARSSQHPQTFSYLRKHLSLIIDESQEEKDASDVDISYTFSGYAPLSVRIVQCVLDKTAIFKNYRKKSPHPHIPSTDWTGAEDVLKYLPGPTVEERRKSANERENKLRRILTKNSPGENKLTSIVFYLGGITYAEIAALQLISARSETHNIIIATTGFINGDKIIDQAATAAA